MLRQERTGNLKSQSACPRGERPTALTAEQPRATQTQASPPPAPPAPGTKVVLAAKFQPRIKAPKLVPHPLQH